MPKKESLKTHITNQDQILILNGPIVLGVSAGTKYFDAIHLRHMIIEILRQFPFATQPLLEILIILGNDVKPEQWTDKQHLDAEIKAWKENIDKPIGPNWEVKLEIQNLATYTASPEFKDTLATYRTQIQTLRQTGSGSKEGFIQALQKSAKRYVNVHPNTSLKDAEDHLAIEMPQLFTVMAAAKTASGCSYKHFLYPFLRQHQAFLHLYDLEKDKVTNVNTFWTWGSIKFSSNEPKQHSAPEGTTDMKAIPNATAGYSHSPSAAAATVYAAAAGNGSYATATGVAVGHTGGSVPTTVAVDAKQKPGTGRKQLTIHKSLTPQGSPPKSTSPALNAAAGAFQPKHKKSASGGAGEATGSSAAPTGAADHKQQLVVAPNSKPSTPPSPSPAGHNNETAMVELALTPTIVQTQAQDNSAAWIQVVNKLADENRYLAGELAKSRNDLVGLLTVVIQGHGAGQTVNYRHYSTAEHYPVPYPFNGGQFWGTPPAAATYHYQPQTGSGYQQQPHPHHRSPAPGMMGRTQA